MPGFTGDGTATPGGVALRVERAGLWRPFSSFHFSGDLHARDP